MSNTQSARLHEQRAALVTEADGLLSNPDATADDITRVETIHAELVTLDERIGKIEAVEARAAEIAEARAAAPVKAFGAAVVKREALTYDQRGDNSFVRDMIQATLRNDRGSWDRLHRHQAEMAVESRTIPNTTDGTGGEFVPPLWLVNEYAEYARAARVTADLLTTMPLPPGTDSINVPKISLGTQVGAQNGQNTTVANRDMTTSTVSAPVKTYAGYEDVSVQLVEQSPLSGGLDRMVIGDLLQDMALQINTAVVNGAGTSGTLTGLLNVSGINSVTYTDATPTGSEMMPAFAQAISQVVKNRFRAPEALVLHPSVWYWLQAQTDTAGRPLVVPTGNGPFNAQGITTAAGAPAGLAGTILGVPVYVDATVPTNLGAGTNQSAVLCAKFSDSYLFESGVKTGVFPDVSSANLTVRFRVHQYAAIAHRFPTAISAITGTGLIVQSGY